MIVRFFAEYSISANENFIDIHALKRAARKLIKQYNFDFHDFPNLAMHEKLTFLKTLFVRKYLNPTNHVDDEDDQSWNEQVKVSIQILKRFLINDDDTLLLGLCCHKTLNDLFQE